MNAIPSNTQKEMTLRSLVSIFGKEAMTVEKKAVKVAGVEIDFSIVFDCTIGEIAILAADYAVVRKVQAGSNPLDSDKDETAKRKAENAKAFADHLAAHKNTINLSDLFTIFGEKRASKAGEKKVKARQAFEAAAKAMGIEPTPEMFRAFLQNYADMTAEEKKEAIESENKTEK